MVLVPSTITAGPNSGDRNIFAAGFGADGSVQWAAATPKPISTPNTREFSPVTYPDGAGGMYMLYTTEPLGAGANANRDLVMRHLSSSGDDLWLDSGRVAITIANTEYREQYPRIIGLGDGSLMIVYEVSYLTEGSDDIDLAAVRISSQGQKLWSGPLWVARTNWRERLAGIVPGDAGSVVAIYQISTRRDTNVYSDIKAIRIDSTSALGWKDSQDPVVVANSRHIESNPAVVSDNKGGAYIAYEVEYTNGARAGDVDLLSQHLTSFGTREWTSESRLPFVSSIDKANERFPTITLDGHDLVIAFQIYYYGVKRPFYLIGMQRIDSTGKLLWQKGKKAETIDLPGFVVESPQLISDPTGGVFLLFEGKDTVTSNRNVYAQKIDMGGVKIWGEHDWGIPVFGTTEIERDPNGIADGTGGLVVVGIRERAAMDGMSSSEIIADRISPDGALPWKDLMAPIVVLVSSNRDERPAIIRSR